MCLWGYKSIKSFPKDIEMDSLVYFNLHGCSKLKIPEFSRGMKNLLHLTLCETAIEKIPSSIERLVGLIQLDLSDCKSLTCIPSAIICKLKSLKRLSVIRCPKLEKLIENEGEMEYCLEELTCLDLGDTPIRELTCLLRMKNLKFFEFHGSRVIRKHDVGFGPLLGRKSPEPLRLVWPSLRRALCSLVTLVLSDLCEGDIPDDIGCLSSLQRLDLSGNNFVTLPASIQCLSKLESIKLNRCERLQQLPDLPSNGRLEVCVDNCASLKMLSEPSKLSKPTDLENFSFKSVNTTRGHNHIKFLFKGNYATSSRGSLTQPRFHFVKKSGARLVYKQDLEELLNGTMNIPKKRKRMR